MGRNDLSAAAGTQAHEPGLGHTLQVVGEHAGVPGFVCTNDRDAGGLRFADGEIGDLVGDKIADLVAAIEGRRDGRFLDQLDGKARRLRRLDAFDDRECAG